MSVDNFILLANSYQYQLHDFMNGMLSLSKIIEDQIKRIDSSIIDDKIKQTFFKLSVHH